MKNQPKHKKPIARQVLMNTISAPLRRFIGIEILITIISPTKDVSTTDIVEN
ncbi:MAG: hypothetical protein IJ725_00180 [Ruminococcus sp.]|nr:hypothetical protein [Ruminococcus sp.]